MKASGVYQGEAMDFLTSRGRISGSVSRITLMVTMIDGGGGGGTEGQGRFRLWPSKHSPWQAADQKCPPPGVPQQNPVSEPVSGPQTLYGEGVAMWADVWSAGGPHTGWRPSSSLPGRAWLLGAPGFSSEAQGGKPGAPVSG